MSGSVADIVVSLIKQAPDDKTLQLYREAIVQHEKDREYACTTAAFAIVKDELLSGKRFPGLTKDENPTIVSSMRVHQGTILFSCAGTDFELWTKLMRSGDSWFLCCKPATGVYRNDLTIDDNHLQVRQFRVELLTPELLRFVHALRCERVSLDDMMDAAKKSLKK